MVVITVVMVMAEARINICALRRLMYAAKMLSHRRHTNMTDLSSHQLSAALQRLFKHAASFTLETI